MGTWNATCAVTQLPIVEGRPVVMIPLIVKSPDFLARDNISGAGSSNNDVLAQPLSLPLRGTYNSGGGIERSKDDIGQEYLKTTLAAYVDEGRLYKIKSAEPVLCKKLPRDFMDLLSAGDLVLMTPHPRKGWLEQLHKIYNEAEDKSGFSHYLPQLKVDPATLPALLPMPLALNFVSATLYDALALKVGQGESYDRWNESKSMSERFKGNRAQQMVADLTLKPAAKKKIELTLASLSTTAQEMLDTQDPGAEALTPAEVEKMQRMVANVMVKKENPMAFEAAADTYFAPHGPNAALTDALLADNDAVRKELVAFSLFASSMNQMRKQWVPQTGAGSQNDLADDSTRGLYELTGQFIASSCSLGRSEEPSL